MPPGAPAKGVHVGGYGSGRGYRAGGRPTTAERLSLCVDEFRRRGLDLGRVEPEDGAALALSFPLSGRPHSYTWRPCDPHELPDGPPAAARAIHVQHNDDGPALVVPLTWHPVGYGWRPAFLCPTCGRRARVLYAAPVQSIGAAPSWTCRTCAGLAYGSTRVDDLERLTTRARRAAAAAGVRDAWRLSRSDLLGASAWRPVGMHRRTWARRVATWRDACRAMDYALTAELCRGWGGFLVGPAVAGAMNTNRAALLAAGRAEFGRRIGR